MLHEGEIGTAAIERAAHRGRAVVDRAAGLAEIDAVPVGLALEDRATTDARQVDVLVLVAFDVVAFLRQQHHDAVALTAAPAAAAWNIRRLALAGMIEWAPDD